MTRQPAVFWSVGVCWVLECLACCFHSWYCLAQQPADPPSKERVLQCIEGLKSKNAVERARAAELLAQAGKAAVPAIPALREATHDAVPAVQIAAVRALAQLSAFDRDADSFTVQMLDGPDRHLRLVALDALAEAGKGCILTEEILLRLLRFAREPTTNQGELALQVLQQCQVRNSRKSAEILAQHLRPEPALTNAVIIRLVQQVPAGGSITAEALCKAMSHPDVQIRATATQALFHLVAEHNEIADWVRLNTHYQDQRLRIARLLGEWKNTRDRRTLEYLLEHCQDGDPVVRMVAYAYLAGSDFSPEEKIKVLLRGLKDGDSRVRRNVARLALQHRELPWRTVLADLETRLRDPVVGPYLVRLVADLDPDAAARELPFLLADLCSPRPVDQGAIATVGACAMELASKSPAVRRQVLQALKELPSMNWLACRNFLLGCVSYRVRIADDEIRQHLVALAKGDKSLLAPVALLVLAEQPDAALLPLFVRHLGSNDTQLVVPAIIGLGNLGPAAKEALPLLHKLAEDKRTLTYIDPVNSNRLLAYPIEKLATEAIHKIQEQKPAKPLAPSPKPERGS